MVHGAGRTDAGVHALGQVAHFDIAAEKRLEEVRGALTFHLKPQPIVVVSAEVAPDGFHARFSATYRRYRYRILNRRTPAALERGHVWHVPVPLDIDAMQAAAAVLIGKHDFNSFRSVELPGASRRSRRSTRSPSAATARRSASTSARARSCTTRCASWSAPCSWSAAANGARPTSRRRWPPRDRTRAGPTAPPHGLCLMEVRYDGSAGGEATTPRKRLTRSDRK